MIAAPRQIWWLNPAWIVGLMGTAVSVAAFTTPESMFLRQWRTPKYFDGVYLAASLGFTAAFVFGAVAASELARDPSPANWKLALPWKWIERAFWISAVLSVAGYLVWGAAAVARGADLGLALGVLRGDKGAVYQMKEVYLVTISGVTTLTQLGIPAIILGVMMAAHQGWRRVWPVVALLFFLAVFRALFNAERLAIIELAIPMIVISLRSLVFESPRFDSYYRKRLQLVPIAGGFALVGLFAGFEYFRSWSTFYSGGDQTFWQFIVLRLTGYYVTALNNGALYAARFDPVWAPFSTLHFLWRFPITGGLITAAYPNLRLDNTNFDPYLMTLDREANQEFNNQSALLPPIVDFGMPGALLYWLLAGLLCGLLYRWFIDGKAAGLLFYPLFFTGVTETTRISYWGEGRAVSAYFILLPLAWYCFEYAKRKPVRRLA